MDEYKNFAYGSVAIAPSPAASGLSLSVQAGEGALFPAVPFNAVVCAAIPQTPISTSAEIVRVTSKGSGDDWTIVRTQESSSARSILVGDQIFAAITKKTLDDLALAPIIYSTIITDAQVKTLLTTPVLLVAGVAGKTLFATHLAARSDVSVYGGVAVNGTVRYVGNLQTAVSAHTIVSTTGKRFTVQGPTVFNIQSATELQGIGLELSGSANAGATYATVDGYHVSLTYVLL
jgi:hypothetical protein